LYELKTLQNNTEKNIKLDTTWRGGSETCYRSERRV